MHQEAEAPVASPQLHTSLAVYYDNPWRKFQKLQGQTVGKGGCLKFADTPCPSNKKCPLSSSFRSCFPRRKFCTNQSTPSSSILFNYESVWDVISDTPRNISSDIQTRRRVSENLVSQLTSRRLHVYDETSHLLYDIFHGFASEWLTLLMSWKGQTNVKSTSLFVKSFSKLHSC